MPEDVNQTEVFNGRFLEAWKAVKEFEENKSQTPLFFDVKAFDDTTPATRTYRTKAGKYTKENLFNYLENPEKNEKSLRNASVYLYHSCQEYKTIINYFSKMLLFDYVTIPAKYIGGSAINPTKLIDSYFRNLEFLEMYNIRNKFLSIMTTLLREDIYFGCEIKSGERYIWKQLPSDYCRIWGFDDFENYIYEFDFTYFSNKGVSIDEYPDEFKMLFNKYQNDKTNGRWQKISSDIGVCFKLDRSIYYGLSLFSAMFPAFAGITEYRDLQLESIRNNNYKLIVFRIPMNEKDGAANKFLVTLDLAKDFHANAKKNIGGNIGVVTTPFPAEGITLNKNSFDENIVQKAENDLWNQAGISQLIVGNGNKSSQGLERSINVDESTMFDVLRQVESFINKKIFKFNETIPNNYYWKIKCPDITVFNRNEYNEALLAKAQLGYNKFIICNNQMDEVNLLILEKHLKLVDDLMIPLKSSYNLPGEANAGAPEKKTKKKDKTVIADETEPTIKD